MADQCRGCNVNGGSVSGDVNDEVNGGGVNVCHGWQQECRWIEERVVQGLCKVRGDDIKMD
ncbi:hypothetical protein QJS10_CPA01g02455 [Acorus calamus]|uniref:Uncharacterized protein n=1 Tax=Acorus calamus TaxID=4465 RepID=A0AAV9FLR8_ACOCL|nr:hypothetical protein QJS10_CPA01g02455 [Acorus calamus]